MPQCDGETKQGLTCLYDTVGTSIYCYYHDKLHQGLYEPILRPSNSEERSIQQLLFEWNLTTF